MDISVKIFCVHVFFSYEQHRYYWWEVWAMLRKVLVDVPPVVPFLDDNLQLVALLTVAVVSLAAHGKL